MAGRQCNRVGDCAWSSSSKSRTEPSARQLFKYLKIIFVFGTCASGKFFSQFVTLLAGLVLAHITYRNLCNRSGVGDSPSSQMDAISRSTANDQRYSTAPIARYDSEKYTASIFRIKSFNPEARGNRVRPKHLYPYSTPRVW